MKMHSRDVARRSVRPSVLSALLVFTSAAHAQEGPATGEPHAETPAPPATSTAADEKSPAASDSAAPAETSATGEVTAPTTGAKPEPQPADARPKPPPLALELLPATAYPSSPIPGIRGGSLALSINHLQWPYMPKYEGEPDFRLGFSGGAWVDTSQRDVKAGHPSEVDQREYRMQGRLTFRVSSVYNRPNDWFLQSNTELVANTEQNNLSTNYVDVDEAWIRAGKWKWGDVTVGRLQGFEVYHFGMGLDLNTFERGGAQSLNRSPAQPYVVDELWDRGVNNGAIALHWYYPEWLRLELLTRLGVSGQGTLLGFRPAGVLDFGFVKAKGGYELANFNSQYIGSEARTEVKGWGASLQFVLDPWVEGGGGFARRVTDSFDDRGAPVGARSHTTRTFGGFVNVRPYFENWLVGFGYNTTDFENFNRDAFGDPEETTHQQMFAAVQYLLWDRFYIKYVLAYAKADIEERNDTARELGGFVNESISHRLRFMLLY
jgi:hypothetical protein